jgi:hypothetical protein
MNPLFLTGIAFYIAGIFLERKIDAKGATMLTTQQLEILKVHFIQLRKRNSIANLILALGYLAALFITDLSPIILISAYVVIYLAIFLVAAMYYIKGLKNSIFQLHLSETLSAPSLFVYWPSELLSLPLLEP